VDPADRGLAYGDGLFETMAAIDGGIRWLDYHLQRLEAGCSRLSIPAPDPTALRDELRQAAGQPGRAVVKLIVTRGVGARGYAAPKVPQPTRIMSISSWPDYPAANYTRGIGLRSVSLRLGENPALAGLKHLCRLEQVLAKIEVGDTAEEGLLLDCSGFVVGGISSNLFMVRGSELATPALERCGVKGIMRRVVMEAAPRLGLHVAERDLTPMDLEQADELFVTNALIGIWPVTDFDQHVLPRGAATSRLMDRLGYGGDA
jgi:4-amino-4-deoxychorismate lyase